jgi:hypothetical protein
MNDAQKWLESGFLDWIKDMDDRVYYSKNLAELENVVLAERLVPIYLRVIKESNLAYDKSVKDFVSEIVSIETSKKYQSEYPLIGEFSEDEVMTYIEYVSDTILENCH